MLYRCQYAATKTADLLTNLKNGSLIVKVFIVLENNAFCFDRSDFFTFDQICNFSAFVYIGE